MIKFDIKGMGYSKLGLKWCTFFFKHPVKQVPPEGRLICNVSLIHIATDKPFVKINVQSYQLCDMDMKKVTGI